jgi:hypothetical protein
MLSGLAVIDAKKILEFRVRLCGWGVESRPLLASSKS